MWRSARRSSGGVVVAARVAQVLLSTGIRRVAFGYEPPCTPGQRGRRTNRRSDRTSVRQRGLTAFVLGFDRPESMYIRREFLYIRRRYQLPRRYRARSRPRRGRGPAFEKVPAAARRQSGSAGWRMTVRAVCESCPCGTRPATRGGERGLVPRTRTPRAAPARIAHG